MTVEYDPYVVTESMIEKAVSDAGYSASVFDPKHQRAKQSVKTKKPKICGVSSSGLLSLPCLCFTFQWGA